jgi:hypothetical protein
MYRDGPIQKKKKTTVNNIPPQPQVQREEAYLERQPRPNLHSQYLGNVTIVIRENLHSQLWLDAAFVDEVIECIC